jgi:Tol biopolymer transport system component
MSYRDNNWEAYLMDVNGAGVKNLSNSPISNDGLPTLSPDGDWVAFVSDREGQWAVWVAPVVGGLAQKLFDLPESPWGDGDRAWTNERISWGP